MRTLALVCLLFIFISFHTKAQNPFLRFKLSHWTTKNGLKDNNILWIHSSKEGFLWLGSYLGLTRFDGVNFKLYNTQNVPNLKSNTFNSIQETSDTTLWITSQNSGLFSYRKGKFKSYFEEYSFLNNSYLDPNDKLVLITDQYDKIINFNTKTKKYQTFEPNIFLDKVKQRRVQAFAKKDSKGNLWFINTEDKHLYKIENHKVKRISTKEGLNDEIQTSIFIDSQDRVWITSPNKLWVKDGNNFRVLPEMIGFNYERAGFYKLGFPNNTFRFYEDKKGGIWLYNLEGLFYLAPNAQKFATLPENHPLLKVTILDITGDVENNIWIASEQGLFQLSESSFITYTARPYDFSDRITGVCALSNTEYLVCGAGNGGEIFWIKNGKSFPYKYKNPLLTNANTAIDVKHVFADSKKNIWISDAQMTLRINKQGEKIISKDKAIRYTYEDREGNIWFAVAFEGIYQWTKNETLEKLEIPNVDFSNSFLSCILKTNNGDWIISSFNNGFFRVKKNGKVEHFDDKNGLESNTIFNCHEDKDGSIWFTSNAGLIHWKNGKIRTITAEDGMPTNSIFDFLLDKEGYIWLPSNEGITRVNKKDLENYITNKSNTVQWRLYDEQDGMENKNCTGARRSTITPSGKILVPTFGGLLEITASKLTKTKSIIPIVIHQVLWENQVQDLTQNNFVFAPGFHRFVFEHSAFSYTAPKKIKFKYRLLGYNNKWIEAGTERKAIYTRLPAGKYTFEVIASNPDGVWNKRGTNFSFIVRPYFYETWWFITLLAIIILALIYAIFRWRTHQIRQRNKKLEDTVMRRTLELNESYEELRLNSEQINAINNRLSDTVKTVALQRDSILDSIQYAQRIQEAILPQPEYFTTLLPQHFVFFNPRDVVSGDFYFLEKTDNGIILATIDCTGHGVPGAFMSMVGHSLLDAIVKDKNITEADKILTQLHKDVRKSLKQSETENRDGMDMALVRIDSDNNVLEFAGAKNPILYIQDDELKEIKGDKIPIGGWQREAERVFTKKTIPLDKTTSFYLFSDGIQDQFGGNEGRKFMVYRLREFLEKNHKKPMEEQKEILTETLINWQNQGNEEQVDDMLLIGIKIENRL